MLKTSNNLDTNKLVSFIQHDLPGLRSGKYHLQVEQSLNDAEGSAISDVDVIGYKFAVAGDRFSMANPQQTVYSVFPAENASGKYNTILPSVVFTKTSFPWSRSPSNKSDEDIRLRIDAATDEDVPTWMTILLIDDQDFIKYNSEFPDFTLEVKIGTIADIFPTSAVGSSTLKNNYSYFSGVSASQVETVLEPGQSLTDTIQMIDIPIPLFRAIAPSVEDLKYMAHIRKVSLINKASMKGISDIGEPEGSFSIVFGNRFPGNNRKTHAYLVSLEMTEQILPGSKIEPDSDKIVRLAVLKHWNFYSTGDNASFVDRLRHLNGATPIDKTEVVNKDLLLNANIRITPPSNTSVIVANALDMGYIPMNHHLRSSSIDEDGSVKFEKTVSWYRGPLVPYIINRKRVNTPVTSADKATIFDPTTGMLDVSYSAAWSIGRQMALQDKNFSVKLFNWKKHTDVKIEQKCELEFFISHFDNVIVPPNNCLTMSAGGANDKNSRHDSFLKRTLMSLNTKKE